MNVFLWGNTGIQNRGCEAIIRSSLKVLGKESSECYLATTAPEQDRKMASELGINMLSFSGYPTIIHKAIYGGMHKICKTSLSQYDVMQKPLFERIHKEDVVLNIGGDTYCYSRPALWMSMNRYAYRNGIKCILWCCSIEKEKITKEIEKDLNRYSYIFAREKLTVQNLLSCGISPDKVIQVCDPAFFLEKRETELPKGFLPGNTVGINVSEVVIKPDNPSVYQNVITTIRYILESTDMSVCLIPHVYNIAENRNDYPILKQIYEEIGDERVSIVDRELSCEQIKYVISKCRFFIGARTHSTIAAYSSCIPTIVIGYSIKSKGIAEDLFGTYLDYVLPYEDLREENQLLNSFKKLQEKEEIIRNKLIDFLPEYKQRLTDAIERFIHYDNMQSDQFEICNSELCTGCSACKQICPQKAISMVPDVEGFLRPEIDLEKCVKCEKCKRVCPSANRVKDTLQKPHTYAFVHSSERIRMNSSSGGAFSAIAEYVIRERGEVFGAGFDNQGNLLHQNCDSINDLATLRGSKYLQSDVGDSYSKVEALLQAGKLVFFTGTPCQVNGLYAYLRKEYQHLITADIICHGCPSPAVWKKYREECEKKIGTRMKSVHFRDKASGWKSYSINKQYVDGSTEIESISQNIYMKGFLSGLFLRPSCYLCPAKQVHRMADITLGDFWGAERVCNVLDDDKGISIVLIHSVKGEKMLDALREVGTIELVDFDAAIHGNKSYFASETYRPLRSPFMQEYRKKTFQKLIDIYCGESKFLKVRRLFRTSLLWRNNFE